jgi:hypothetical protein
MRIKGLRNMVLLSDTSAIAFLSPYAGKNPSNLTIGVANLLNFT